MIILWINIVPGPWSTHTLSCILTFFFSIKYPRKKGREGIIILHLLNDKSATQRNWMTMTRNQNCWSLDGCFLYSIYKATVPWSVQSNDSMARIYLIYTHFEESNQHWIPLVTFPSGSCLLLEQYLGDSNFKSYITANF